MKIRELREVEIVSDIVCDVCLESARVDGDSLQYGLLQAHWGYGSAHDGELYEIHLCESCFFQTIASLKQQRRGQTMFSDNEKDRIAEDFGRVATHDFFNDGGRSAVKPGA